MKAVRVKRRNHVLHGTEMGSEDLRVHIRKSAGCVGDAPVCWLWKVRSFRMERRAAHGAVCFRVAVCSLQERSRQGWAGFTAHLGRMGNGGPSRSGAKGDSTASVRNISASSGGTRSDFVRIGCCNENSVGLRKSRTRFGRFRPRSRSASASDLAGKHRSCFGILRSMSVLAGV